MIKGKLRVIPKMVNYNGGYGFPELTTPTRAKTVADAIAGLGTSPLAKLRSQLVSFMQTYRAGGRTYCDKKRTAVTQVSLDGARLTFRGEEESLYSRTEGACKATQRALPAERAALLQEDASLQRWRAHRMTTSTPSGSTSTS